MTLNEYLEQIANKNIAIVGFGLEGKSTYNFYEVIFQISILQFLK